MRVPAPPLPVKRCSRRADGSVVRVVVRLRSVAVAVPVALGLAACGGSTPRAVDATPPAATKTTTPTATRAARIADADIVVEDAFQTLLDHLDPRTEIDDDETLLAKASDVQRHFYRLAYLNGDVLNGGFAQHFINDGGADLDEAISAARAAGAERHAAILEDAAALFSDVGEPPGVDAVGEYQTIAKRPTMSALDRRWAALQDELDQALAAYVLSHPGELPVTPRTSKTGERRNG